MEINGIIKTIGDKEQITPTFSKVEMILDISTYKQGTGEKYENAAKVQFVNGNIDKLAPFKVGDRVKISFGIHGKETTTAEGKVFFNQNLNAYKIEKL